MDDSTEEQPTNPLVKDMDLSAWENLENDNEDLLKLNDDLNFNTSSLRSDERYVGFDNNVADTWIYPSNFPERAYQFNIVQKALFSNTLVVLPTGLGKTFIAAVVMYNIFRWYPMGKIIFMAPTRPLVAQQIDACCKIVGIPISDSVEITGKLSKSSRVQLWQSKRVFFATPQSVQSDIMDSELNFPFQAVKLIVVDEAHKAKGRYSYTEVIRHILSKNRFFRILALSATPGRRKEDVEEVIRNLFISNLEVRTEECVDVVSYVHKRKLKVVVVELGPKLSAIRDDLLEIADPHIRNLIENRLISGRPGSISRNWLVLEQKKFREFTLNNRTPYQKEINSDFSICISVYHAIELLERHGLRVFLNNFDETQEGGPKFVLILKPELKQLIKRAREEIGPNPFAFSDQCMVNGEIAAIPSNIDFGHPKFEIARDHVLTHFENNKDARVIIFCEYRESVMLMHRLLLQHRPLIRPRLFVGKGGTGSIRAVTQQQQIKVMSDFRSGESNALIATSVAEEGIDVGEVDLIVCFDMNTSNPTRFIQRIGRTGRKKEGKVLLLATEGKEHTMLKEVLSERNKLNKSISRAGQFTSVFYKHSPRMVPTEFNPKVLKTLIQIPEEPDTKSKEQPSKLKKAIKDSRTGQKKDLRHFFKQKNALDDEEMSIFENMQPLNIPFKNPENTILIDDAENLSHISLPPKSTEIKSKMIKKMAKYVRNNLKGPAVDPFKAITSNKLSKDCLKYLLDSSPKLLFDVWTRIQELWSKGIDENNIATSRGISTEDRQIIRVYLRMLEVYEDKENITSYIAKNTKNKQKSLNYCNLIDKYKFVFEDMRSGGITEDGLSLLIKKFEKSIKLFPLKECGSENYVQSMIYDDEVEVTDQDTPGLNENSHDYSTKVLDSKYMSQWGQKINKLQNYSHAYGSPRASICALEEITISTAVKSNVLPENENESKIISTVNDSDDDIVFVGRAQQHSTPLQKRSLKQSLLNFHETPISSSVMTRHHNSNDLPNENESKTISGANDSDDDIIFVGTAEQYGTPKRKESLKQSVLNFHETSIPSSDTKRHHKRFLLPKISTKMAPKIAKNMVEDYSKSTTEFPEPQKENHMSFFDDQFDEILAANSEAINEIENNNIINTNIKKSFDTSSNPNNKEYSDIQKLKKSSYYQKQPVAYSIPIVTTSTLGSDDSTPDEIFSPANTPKKPKTVASCSSLRPLGVETGPPKCSEFTEVKSSLNLVPKNLFIQGVHPEIADIDFNNFSEVFSNEIDENFKTVVDTNITKPQESFQRASPDIFDDLCEPISEIKSVSTEKSPKRHDSVPPESDKSPCLLTKKVITWREVRQKYLKKSQLAGFQRNENKPKLADVQDVQNESVVNLPSKIKSKIRIIRSESESSEEEFISKRKKKVDVAANKELNRKALVPKSHPISMRSNEFIDNEAILSGSATEDENDQTIGCYMYDSVVVNDDEAEDESAIPMTGVYLQSLNRSTGRIRGAFKIPECRRYDDAANIFSQRVPENNSSYMQNSFVVRSDEEESDDEKSLCPLERAEKILKMKSRAKRKVNLDDFDEQIFRPAKKKRVLRIHSSSEENDEFV